MNYRLISIGLVFLIFLIACNNGGTPEKETAAINSTKTWLQYSDDEMYMECFNQSADFLQTTNDMDEWREQMITLRKPLGKIVSRQQKAIHFKTTVEGLPEGEYYVIIYKTVFYGNKTATETVVVMFDSTKSWRIADYKIK